MVNPFIPEFLSTTFPNMNKPIRYLNWATFVAIGVAILTTLKQYTNWRWIPFNDWTAFSGFCGIAIAVYGVQYLEAKRLVKAMLENPDIDIGPIFNYLKKTDYKLFLECVELYDKDFMKAKSNRILILKVLTNTTFFKNLSEKEKKEIDDLLKDLPQEKNLKTFTEIKQNIN